MRLERTLLMEHIDRKRNFSLRNRIKAEKYEEDEPMDRERGESLTENLLNRSIDDMNEEITEERRSIKRMSKRSSRSSFRFTECTICLSNFREGDAVKVVPGCNHVFHESCFNDWVALRWRCPNCNTEIVMDGMEVERQRYS